MKIVTPPQITDLDELLDVVLHPEKLAERLQQLKDMRDAILANLGLVTTKEQADEYLVAADVKLRDAKAMEDKIQEERDVHEEDLAQSKAAFAEQKRLWGEQTARERHVIEQQRNELAKRETDLSDALARLAVREADILANQVLNTQRKQALDAEYQKIASAKKTLESFAG